MSTIVAHLNDRATALLEELAHTGIFGEDENEVVAHLVLDGLQDAVDRGFIGLAPIATEAPHPALRNARDEAGVCRQCHGAPIGSDCPTCGAHEIPF